MIHTPSSSVLWQLCEMFDSLFLMQSQWLPNFICEKTVSTSVKGESPFNTYYVHHAE